MPTNRGRRGVWTATMATVGVALLALGACGAPDASDAADASSASSSSSPGSPPGDTGGSEAVLAGRSFGSTDITGHELVPDTSLIIDFRHDGTIATYAGCNRLFGDASWSGSELTVAAMGGTEMGCPAGLMEQDHWWSGLLTAGVDVEVHERGIVISSDDVRITMEEADVNVPSRPLEGTRWSLQGIVEPGTSGQPDDPSASVSSVPAGIEAWLQIDDGRLNFFDGINRYSGPQGPDGKVEVTFDDDSSDTGLAGTVRVRGEITGTLVGCADGVECYVDMSVLTAPFAFRINGDQLWISTMGVAAEPGLLFVADSASGDGTDGASPGRSSTDNDQNNSSTGSDSPGGNDGSDAGSSEPSRGSDGSHTGTAGSGPGMVDPATPTVPTAQAGPSETPGTLTDLTGSVGTRPAMTGARDSIPPQPTPDGK